MSRISTSNIDANGGADYGSLVNLQISFSPGDPAVQSISVAINDDNIVENNERFTATLTAENGVNIQPGGGTATVTILDNDGGYFCLLNNSQYIKFNKNLQYVMVSYIFL